MGIVVQTLCLCDNQKKRAAERVRGVLGTKMSSIFSGVVAVIVGLAPGQTSIYKTKIEKGGGRVVAKADETVTHVVCEKAEVKQALLAKHFATYEAREGRYLVTMVYFHDCVTQKKLLDPVKYGVKIEDNEVVEHVAKKARGVGGAEDALPPHPVDEITEGCVSPKVRHSACRKDLPKLEYDPQQVFVIPKEDMDWLEPDAQDIEGVWRWVQRPHFHFRFREGANVESKQVAAFDFDDTIIRTEPLHSLDLDDFCIKPRVMEALSALHNAGVYICFLSNQGGLSDSQEKVNRVKAFHRKIDCAIDMLKLPIDFICAIGDGGLYRKPAVGMFQFLMQHRCVNAELAQSYFVGDAAGRPAMGDHPKDFSDSDYKLAVNLGIDFYTPESFFEYSTDPYHTRLPPPDPRMRLCSQPFLNLNGSSHFADFLDSVKNSNSPVPEIVLLVAPPACGKSTVANMFLQSGKYLRVNQDTLKTLDKCKNLADQAIKLNKSVVVDNCNITSKTRMEWVSFANDANVPIRCIIIDTKVKAALMMSKLRLSDPKSSREDRHRIVKKDVIESYFKLFENVGSDEGFVRVDTVLWAVIMPSPDHEAELHALYHMFLPVQ